MRWSHLLPRTLWGPGLGRVRQPADEHIPFLIHWIWALKGDCTFGPHRVLMRHHGSSVGSGPPSGRHEQLFRSTSAAGKEIGSSVSLRREAGWDPSEGWGGERGLEGEAGRKKEAQRTHCHHLLVGPPSLSPSSICPCIPSCNTHAVNTYYVQSSVRDVPSLLSTNWV